MNSLTEQFHAKYGPFALVTGASEGIGRSFATELAKRGLNVLLVARRADALKQLSQELESKYKVLCPVLVADLSVPADVENVLHHAQQLDMGLVICNAGYGTAGNFLDSDLETEMNMLRVNCDAVTRMVHVLGRQLRTRGKGGMVLMSSIVATQGAPRSANYAASKAYIHSLGEALQEEWCGLGIDLLLVAPGPVATGFAKRSKMQMGQAATPDVVAIESLEALGKKRLVHPGWLAKLLFFSLATAPRNIRVKIMGVIMNGMTKQLR
jgi:short-subunit dehydrogenase